MKATAKSRASWRTLGHAPPTSSYRLRRAPLSSHYVYDCRAMNLDSANVLGSRVSLPAFDLKGLCPEKPILTSEE